MSTSVVHPSRLRITRRGRAVLLVAVAVPVVLFVLWLALNSGTAGAASQSSAAPVVVQHVTVKQGESLWQVAEAVAPQQDPRDVVSAIVDFNGLQSSVVMPGQSLAVPPQFTSSR
jgi:hypothetical protein